MKALGIEGVLASQASALANELNDMAEEFRNRRLDALECPVLRVDAPYGKARQHGGSRCVRGK